MRSSRGADRVLSRLLDLMLACYPAGFRATHGDELRRFWEAQANERRYSGPLGRVRLAAHLGRDALVTGLRMRRREAAGGEGVMGTVWMDLRSAWRALRATPAFALLAIVTLSLGVASVTAVFGVVDGVLLRPLPYPDPDRLVEVLRTDDEEGSIEVSWPDFRDWAASADGFRGLAGYAEAGETFEWEGGAEVLTGARVTQNYFDVMGVPLALGRTFTPEEDAFGGPRAIVLSHALWRGRFEADPGILGRTLPVGGEAVPIVGVAAEGFSAPFAETHYWLPMQDDQLLADVGLPTGSRSLSFIDVVGRLEGGVEPSTAGAGLRALAHRIDDEAGKRPEQRSNVLVVPMVERMVGGVRATLLLLLVAGALVLLVSAANVAGLAFSRRLARRREMAVRTALGAARGRLVRQLLAEGLLLAAAAGLGGFFLAWSGQIALVRLAPAGLPRLSELEVGLPSLGFAFAAALASGLLFGLLPSLGLRTDPGDALGGRGQSVGRAALRPQRLLVTIQVALAVVLLTGAALLSTSFVRLLDADRGFRTESLVVATVAPSEDRYASPEEKVALYEALLARVRGLPDVVAASTTYSPPLFGNDFATSVVPEGREEDRGDRFWAGTVIIGDDYFAANGIDLVAGRPFDEDDRLGQPLVAIVNREMAERLWPGEDPLGRRFTFSGGLRGTAESFDRAFFPDEPMTVVGVAEDVRREGLDRAPVPEYYRPHAQLTWAFQYLLVRTAGDPSPVAERIRETVWAVDPSIPVRDVRTMRDQVSESVADPRFRMLLVVLFAVLTATLAMVGLYAVMTLAVQHRVREMGIRLALGASRASVVSSTVRSGVRLVALGVGAGVGVSAFAGRAVADILAGMLFEVEPVAPAAWGAVALLVLSVGVGASWLPARRAGRVDPVVSLQSE